MTTPFCEARAHPIVAAFEVERSKHPGAGKTVGPAAGDRTLFHLGVGHDHRGATWHDRRNGVVWLCAYGRHRSGQAGDAFAHFTELLRGGRIRPTVDDFEALFTDRDRRFVDTVHQDAQALVRAARAEPGVEQAGVVGGQTTVAVVVEVVEGLEETFVAFSVVDVDYRRVLVILAAFYPEASFLAWELANELPTRALRTKDSEVCYRTLRGAV